MAGKSALLVFRPLRENDLPVLAQLANSIGGGLTTLPPDEEVLGDRIADSLRAFSPRVKRPGGEYYLFVLEDSATGEIVGTSGIASRVGGFEPWYGYEIRGEKFAHPPLAVEKEIATLHLKKEHRGPSEVCSLFLRSDRRHGGHGRLLSLSRFVFIAAFRARFTDTVVAELRGYVDDTRHSPFWDAVGQIFFESDFYRADLLSGLGDKEFIAAPMPKHPIYVPLLPQKVQAVIGRPHRDTEPALALLRAEGSADTNDFLQPAPMKFASINPATGETVWTGPAADAAEVDRAVGKARAAFRDWSRRTEADREAQVRAFAKQLEARQASFAEATSREVGKPAWEALTEVQTTIGKVELSIKTHAQRCGEFSGGPAITRFRPHGVVAVFGPFNFPGHLPNAHIVPALLAGNTVIFKSSEHAPLVAELTAAAWREAGLPDGVLNLVRERAKPVPRWRNMRGSTGCSSPAAVAPGSGFPSCLRRRPRKFSRWNWAATIPSSCGTQTIFTPPRCSPCNLRISPPGSAALVRGA